MGKTRRRHVRVSHFEDKSGNTGRNVTMSIHRQVYPNEHLGPIQNYIEHVMEENGVWSTHRLPLDGLRLTLMPTTPFGRLRSQNGELNNIDQGQQCAMKALTNRRQEMSEVSATRGVLLRGGRNSSAAFVFEDPRLIAEQEAIYTALGQERDQVRVPNMSLCVLPRVKLDVATKLNQGLSELAPLVAVALGPAYCDIRTVVDH